MATRRLVLRSWWASATYFGLGLFVGLCVMGLALSAVPITGFAFAAALLGPPACLGLFLAWRIAVFTDGSQVVVRNPIRTHRYERGDLRTVELGRENYIVGAGKSLPMLQLRVRDGRTPIQVVASVRVTERARASAKTLLLATRGSG